MKKNKKYTIYDNGTKTVRTADYKTVSDLIAQSRGIDSSKIDSILNKIAYHETDMTLNPQMKQYGGGIGRGLFQYEPESLKTALKRSENFFKRNNLQKPDWFANIKDDASVLNSEQQKMLAIIDMYERPKFDLKAAAKDDEGLIKSWSKGWQTTNNPEKEKHFKTHLDSYYKKFPDNSNIPSKLADIEKFMYKNGTQGVRYPKYYTGVQDVTVPQGGTSNDVMSGAMGGTAMGLQIGMNPALMSATGGLSAPIGAAVGLGAGLYTGQRTAQTKTMGRTRALNQNANLLANTYEDSMQLQTIPQGYAKYGLISKSTKHIEAEGDEIVMKRDKKGRYYMKKFLKGNSHKEGGINMIAEEGDVIFPKKMKAEVLQSYKGNDNRKLESLRSKLPKDENINYFINGTDGVTNPDYQRYRLNPTDPDYTAKDWRRGLATDFPYSTNPNLDYDNYLKETGITGLNRTSRTADETLAIRKGFADSMQQKYLTGLMGNNTSVSNMQPINNPDIPFNYDAMGGVTAPKRDVQIEPAKSNRRLITTPATVSDVERLPKQGFDYTDAAYGLGEALPTLYNLGMGLFGKTDKLSLGRYNPTLAEYKDLSERDRLAVNQGAAIQRYNMGNRYMSRGQGLGESAMIENMRTRNLGMINQGEARRRFDIYNRNIDTRNQSDLTNLGYQQQETMYDKQAKGRKQNFLAKGLEGTAGLSQTYRKESYDRELVDRINDMEMRKLATTGFKYRLTQDEMDKVFNPNYTDKYVPYQSNRSRRYKVNN